MSKKALLLMNVGSPDQPEVTAVRRYLTQFLNDKRVIDLPYLLRKFLVNAIIIPSRVKNSTKLYQTLWTEKGSPLIYYSEELQKKLQERLKDQYDVFLGMRYGNPSYTSALTEIKNKGYKELTVLPLFPQFAMSTTETAIVAVKDEIKKQNMQIDVEFVNQFYNHPKFIEAFSKEISKYNLADFDHIIFSFHGLPDRHIHKIHPKIKIEQCSCEKRMPKHGIKCYRATCYETARLLAESIELNRENYSVSFQSRLSKNWLTPFTDHLMLEKLQQGNKRILVVAPAFVTDCLETIVEIGIEYQEIFKNAGGKTLQLVASLNANDSWVEAIEEMVL